MKNYIKFQFLHPMVNENLHADYLRQSTYGTCALRHVGRTDFMKNVCMDVLFHIKGQRDIAGLVKFDNAVQNIPEEFRTDGLTWSDNIRKLRQPRVILDDDNELHASEDAVCLVMKQPNPIPLGYSNQTTGVRTVLNVVHWVVIGEINHTNKIKAHLKDFFSRKINRGSTAVSTFVETIIQYESNDQFQIYGMDDQGTMLPVVAPRRNESIVMGEINDWLNRANYLTLNPVVFN